MAQQPIILTDQIIPPPALARAGLDLLPAAIRARGERAGRRFIEFFTATIRNRNTRMAYARAVKPSCPTPPAVILFGQPGLRLTCRTAARWSTRSKSRRINRHVPPSYMTEHGMRFHSMRSSASNSEWCSKLDGRSKMSLA